MRTLEDLTAEFARQDAADAFLVKALGIARHGGLWHDPTFVSDFVASRPSIRRSVQSLVVKAATAPVDLSSGLGSSSPDALAFLAQVQRVTPLGQIAGVTVSGNITAALQTGNASAFWVGEAVSKPVTSLSFASAALRPLKLIAQVVMSAELADLSAPDALSIVRRALISAAAAAESTTLLDSTITAIAGVRPASIVNGVSPITPSGDFATNVGQVLSGLSGGDPSRPVLVVSFQTAIRMQSMLRDLREIGVRVVISSAAGNKVIGIDADGLLVNDGGVEIQKGTPDVQLSDTPDSPPTAATVFVSTWQRNLVALKLERWVNWTVRSGAVATLTLA